MSVTIKANGSKATIQSDNVAKTIIKTTTPKITIQGGVQGVTNYLGLTDTPSSYTGQANKIVSVKEDETGLEFTGGTGGSTNLSYTASPTDGTVNSDTGTSAVIPATDGTNAGLFLSAEKTKLDGIETGAEVNNISDVNATDLTDGGDTTLHIHDSRYYTETETDTLLNNKIDLNGNNSAITYANFTASSAPDYQEGRLWYDSNTKALSVYDNFSGTSIQLGKELIIDVRNNSGTNILNGQAVYISGALGQNPTIALARADSLNTSQIIGIATHDINNNTSGKVTLIGIVNDIDTSSFTDGQQVYLSASTDGGLTATPPASPNFVTFIGYIAHAHPTQGKLLVVSDRTMANNNNLGTSQIIFPTQNAVKSYVDTGLNLKANLSGATFTGNVYLTNQRLYLNNFDYLTSAGAGQSSFISPFAQNVTFESQQSGQQASFVLKTAEGKLATIRHSDVASAGGRRLDISTQPAVSVVFSPSENEMLRLDGFGVRNATSTANWTITSWGTTQIPLKVKGIASQTANLQEWQNSSSTVLSSVTSNGFFGINRASSTSVPLSIQVSSSSFDGLYLHNNSGTLVSDFGVTGGGHLRWRFRNSSGTIVASINADGVTDGIITPVAPTPIAKPIVARGAVNQTANLTEWQNSSSTVLAKVETDGSITSKQFKLTALNTAPSSASDTGTTGEIRYDSNYMYVCVATNTWKRSALSTW